MRYFFMVIFFLFTANLISAQGQLGEEAFPLNISKWLKGKEVKLERDRGKNIYVIEFWATWCPPCRSSIPHLTEIQKKYKDKNVVVIGITQEKLEVVKPFVDQMGDQMDYTVAIDNYNVTTQNYTNRFGTSGIPHAFVVDKQGKIAWHGHPMSPNLETVLDSLLDGTYDKKNFEEKGTDFVKVIVTILCVLVALFVLKFLLKAKIFFPVFILLLVGSFIPVIPCKRCDGKGVIKNEKCDKCEGGKIALWKYLKRL
jgi:thiol-disulfide isomerase/thioredoxin